MIVITGATGQLGRSITERLLERVAPERIGVSVRDPEKASDLAERGVRVRRADFGDAASLRHAFEGAAQVLVVSTNATGDLALAHHRTAIETAGAVGADRILYTSHMGSDPASAFAPMPDHAETEVALEASGVAFTSLRNGFYAATALQLMGPGLESGTIVAPEDGPVSWTTHADLAEGAAAVLEHPGRLDGPTPPLTGPEALDLAGLAALASEVTGRTIARVTVSDDDYRASLLSRGVPEARADMLVGLFVASRRGAFAAVDPTLEGLLGRPPTTMREVLAATVQGAPALR